MGWFVFLDIFSTEFGLVVDKLSTALTRRFDQLVQR